MKRPPVLVAPMILLAATLPACSSAGSAPAPTFSTISDSDAQSMYEEDLNEYASYLREGFPDINLPLTEIVRYLEPHEYGPVMSQCLSDLGFEATAMADGGISFGHIPDEQAQAQSAAIYTCRSRYPVHPQYQQPYTESQKAYLYEYIRDDLIPCIQESGVQVPDIPSYQQWNERVSPGGSGWDAFSSVITERGFDELQQLYHECPPKPAGLWGPPAL